MNNLAPTHALSFKLESEHCLSIMENVLAIARRGGLRLQALRVDPSAAADNARLELSAPEDMLALFLARLENVIGVQDVHLISSQLKS